MNDVEWHEFTCNGCGEPTFAGLEPGLTAVEKDTMIAWIFGDPPTCTTCRQAATQPNRQARRALRRPRRQMGHATR